MMPIIAQSTTSPKKISCLAAKILKVITIPTKITATAQNCSLSPNLFQFN